MVGKSLKKWWPVFVLPTLAAFIIGFLWPFIWGIYLSFCKFSTVKDVVWVGLSNYQKIFIGGDFSHAFWLTVVFAFVSSILINVLAFDKRLQRNKRVPYCILHAEPDRWYCTWLYLADTVKRSAFHVGTASSEVVCNKWFYWNDHPVVMAADWIYDDHLCGWS